MKVYVVADTHFGHANVLRYESRPFPDVEKMDVGMAFGWNNVVGKDDIVYHLGDFCMGPAAQIVPYRARLNGRIFLVKGNHDSRKDRVYFEAGFERVYDKSILVDGCILSHAPIYSDPNAPHDFVNIHGHVHGNPAFPTIARHSRCVSVERTGYVPMRFELVKAEVAEFAG